MKPRGFTIIQMGLAVAALGLLTALALAAKGYLEDVDERAFQRGVAQTTALWEKRANQELADAQAEIERLRTLKDAAARAHQAELHQAAQDYEKRRAENERSKDRFVADVRAGRVVLRDPGRTAPPACPQAGGGAGSAPAAPVAGGDDAKGGGLSGEAAEFLLGEAARANAVVDQLTLAQRELRSTWEACKAR